MKLSRILQVLLREYKSTVMTKAFFFGAIIFPAVFYSLMFVIPMIVKTEAPQMKGTVAIVDETGKAADLIEAEFNPAAINMFKQQLEEMDRPTEEGKKKQREMMEQAQQMGGAAAAIAVKFAARKANPLLEQPTPELKWEVVGVERAADEEALNKEIDERINKGEILAFIHLKKEALQPLRSGQITLLTPEKMNAKNVAGLEYGIRRGVLNARLASEGLNAFALQLKQIPANITTNKVTEGGQVKSIGEAQFLVPFAFMMLLWISTFTGGQYLLMSTVEEKSSRVMEVMLSAVSSMQMMTGKILGQGAVAFTMLAVYMAGGLSALDHYDLLYLVPVGRLAIFAPYFFMAFLFVACMMATVGAAVNDVREANALLGPAMMVLIVPFLLIMPIIENPNSTLAVVTSFIPPLTPFIMAIRLGGAQDIPTWQIAATMAVGWAAVLGGMWFTAKVFRIGVLMYGKPPNLKTLVSWVRQA